MPTVARDTEDERRRAWDDYAERLKGLEGAEYERAEAEAWDELQSALGDAGVASSPDDQPLG